MKSIVEKTVREFDPDKQHRNIRDRLHTFDLINERFARQFRISVFNLIRRNPDVTVKKMEYMSYRGFSENVPVPTNINLIQMKPLHGTALVMFPPELVFMVVDLLFGGDGTFTADLEGRDFTNTENRIIRKLLDLAIESYAMAWSSVYEIDINYIRSEMQAKFANITNSPNDVVVATTFHIDTGSISSDFHICIPYAMLDPVRDLLTNPGMDRNGEDDTAFHASMAEEIPQTHVDLQADFVNIDMKIGQLMKLKKGDILPVELPDSITAKVDGVPVMECRYGRTNDHHALRVIHMIDHGAGHIPVPPQYTMPDASEEISPNE